MIYLILGIAVLVLIGLLPKKPSHTYNAKWGNPSESLSRLNLGFAVTGSKALTKKQSFENCALFGPTGSGKSSIVILSSIASLARGDSSMVVNDTEGDAWKNSSGFLASNKYQVHQFNPAEALRSESFNPLSQCKTTSDIQKLMLILVRNSTGTTNADPFWEQSSIMVLSIFARYLLFHTEEKFHTFQNVLRLVEKFSVNGAEIDALFAKTADEELLSSYKATVAIPDKTLQSIIATIRTSLSLFSDPEVCKATATNSFTFDLLRKERVALFISIPVKDLQYFKPLSAIFFQSLFNHILSEEADSKTKSIFILLEESATYRFPALSTTISLIRKHHAGILLCMQDEAALISQYGQAEAHQIKTNCGTQIYLPGTPLHSAKELSQMLGKQTLIDDKGTEHVRELMTPDEIHMCNEAIILIGNKPPLKCRTVPYYKNIFLSKLRNSRPVIPECKSIVDPPLIPFI